LCITEALDIFGMSFFMHVKHNSGLDELFNFETCMRSMMVLFQVSFINILRVVIDLTNIVNKLH